jgi:hypothetical protein
MGVSSRYDILDATRYDILRECAVPKGTYLHADRVRIRKRLAGTAVTPRSGVVDAVIHQIRVAKRGPSPLRREQAAQASPPHRLVDLPPNPLYHSIPQKGPSMEDSGESAGESRFSVSVRPLTCAALPSPHSSPLVRRWLLRYAPSAVSRPADHSVSANMSRIAAYASARNSRNASVHMEAREHIR